MRRPLLGLLLLSSSIPAAAQSPGKFPPDSLVNVQIFPKNTPPIRVIGTMRNISGGLGVRCQFCHIGEEGKPLETFDFVSDEKRTKQVARQMMRMVQEINRRVDTIPGRVGQAVEVTCTTCHRGVTRPIPLAALIADVATTSGADSAVRAYRGLRERYYGRATYDFGEGSLNTAAFQLSRADKFREALAILAVNEEFFPRATTVAVFRGNILLRQGDTTAAAESFREALRRDPSNQEARGRLREINRNP